VNDRVLLVEDDASICELVALGLGESGFQVDAVRDGASGLAQFRQARYDVVLDVMLPSLGGFDVLRAIRGESRVPVVMLTARTGTVDIVVGLELGADDYVCKPFEVPELAARLRAALRRSGEAPVDVIVVGELEVDAAAFQARLDGVDVGLTTTEFRLLLELARHRGQVLSREQLLERVWGYGYLGDSRLVDVAVRRLRGKVGGSLIQTVRGVGYRLL
jgi:two-component system, OmpR family, response regulator MtrA